MNFKLVNENIDDFYLTNQQQHDIVPLSESSEPQKSSTSPIDCQDLCIQEHKNGLFVISLSPKHSLSGSCSELKVHQVEFPLRPTPPAVLVNSSGMNEGDDLVETSNKQTNPSASSQQLQKKKEIKVQPHTLLQEFIIINNS
ncbi:hypothetical protein C9374_004701 [Naegleria lovaniensis]|uniref:Uncharacterized protein n=1 Tax=Naegleria lovaniensis TaxID=51637 RepID=A0AA88GQL2_NAELO|nr:uncharacterized protein C9374_004701 [Naegleria lovaniensis]KAG2383364.1 hypothetical protein C9374_004701 [Naegleria lovaniensis]